MLGMVAMAAMGLAGGSAAKSLREKEKMLGLLLRELHSLEEDVRIGRPLKEALSGPDTPFFGEMSQKIEQKGVHQAWMSICRRPPLDLLDASERRSLDSLWAEMGMLDRTSQLARIREVTNELTRLHVRASEETAAQSRLYGMTGFLLGLAILVLLW